MAPFVRESEVSCSVLLISVLKIFDYKYIFTYRISILTHVSVFMQVTCNVDLFVIILRSCNMIPLALFFLCKVVLTT